MHGHQPEYEQRGDPDAPHELTKADHRRQREAERMKDAIRRMHNHRVVGEDGEHWMSHTHDDDELGHTHPPEQQYPRRADGGYLQPETGPANRDQLPIPEQAVDAVRTILRHSREHLREHPEDLAVWRLRLYCGHVVERTAHYTHTTILRDGACEKCGLDPASIVAARMIRRQDPLEPKRQPKQPKPKAPTVTERIARLEAELAELRQQSR